MSGETDRERERERAHLLELFHSVGSGGRGVEATEGNGGEWGLEGKR